MPDHPISYGDDDEEADAPAVPHDDIMKRLLDYQRQMRESEPGEEVSEPSFGEPSPAETPATERLDAKPAEGDVRALEETPAYEEPEFDVPAALQEADVQEEAPAPRRGFFRSNRAERSSRRDVDDIPALEDATNLRDVPDFDDLAPPPPPLSGSVAAELEARIAGFERSLHRLQTHVVELRQTFADMAVAADERLGAIEDAIAKARAERFS